MIRIASVLPFTPPSPVREVKSHSFCQMNPQPHAVSVSAGLFKPRPGNPTCLRVLFGLRSVQHSVVGSNQGYEWNQGYVLCNGHGAVALTVYTNQSTQEKGMEVTASNLRDPRRGLNDFTGPRPWYLQDAAILRCGHLGTPQRQPQPEFFRYDSRARTRSGISPPFHCRQPLHRRQGTARNPDTERGAPEALRGRRVHPCDDARRVDVVALQLHAHEEAHRHLALPPPPSEPPCAKRGAETHRPKSTLGPVYNKWQLTKGIGEGEDTTKGSLAHKGRWARARPHVLRKAGNRKAAQAPGAEAASRGVA